MGQHRGVGISHLSEDVEVLDPPGFGSRLHRGNKGAPEGRVDVLGRIDPKTVDGEIVDPLAVDVDEALHDPGIFREEVVEPGKVAVGRALALVRGLTAIVVPAGIVQPVRSLHMFLALGDVGRVGVVRTHELGEVLRRLVRTIVALEAVIDGRAIDAQMTGVREVALAAVVAVAPLALPELDDVGGVVGDDVEIDLHPPRMRCVHQALEIRPRAEMRIDVGEVGDPVAVIARALLAGRALDRLVLEDRPQPDRRDAQPLDVVKARQDALQIAAVVEPLAGRIIAGLEAVAL